MVGTNDDLGMSATVAAHVDTVVALGWRWADAQHYQEDGHTKHNHQSKPTEGFHGYLGCVVLCEEPVKWPFLS